MAGNWFPLLNQIRSLPDMLSWGRRSATQLGVPPPPAAFGQLASVATDVLEGYEASSTPSAMDISLTSWGSDREATMRGDFPPTTTPAILPFAK